MLAWGTSIYGNLHDSIQSGAPFAIAKLVNITLISLGLMVDISIVSGIINQQTSLGGHHLVA